MEISGIWKYLDNVWIVTGLVLVLLVSLLKMLSVNNLNSRKSKQQMQKGINYLFVLGLSGVILSTLFSQSDNLTALQQNDTSLFDATSFPTQDTANIKASQAVGNDSGAAVGTGSSADFNQLLHVMPARTRSERPNTADQRSKDDSGAAINVDEDDFSEEKK